MADLVNPVNTAGDEVSDYGALLEMLARSRPPWQRDALCREHPDLPWFAERGQDPRSAKRLCQECLAFADCRRWSLDQGPELQGVWAGLDQRERRQMRVGRAA